MSKIFLNDELKVVSANTLDMLLREAGFEGGKIAVAINSDLVPRSAYSDTPIMDGDRIDVLVPIQGG